MANVKAIEVKGLTKAYKLYAKPVHRLKEALSPFRSKYHTEFLALKDINFEVMKGQIVGIIGKNGSGKSTLLKILTGVLTPTTGTVTVHGKVAALLELGAGFNPELTGLENIYLNGSLMGYSRSEMKSKLEAILEFAEIGDFVFQPVKMYSSGMFVRLAFAVAINVDPDILIVDEALSVGDIRFQQKCIRKIQEFFKSGKTVLFVGHDLAAIKSFCTICLWINEGVLIAQGSPQDITKQYTSFMAYGLTSESKVSEAAAGERVGWIDLIPFESFGDRQGIIDKMRVVSNDGQLPTSFVGGEELALELEIDVNVRIENPILGFVVKDRLGNSVFGGNTFGHEIEVSPLPPGKHLRRIRFKFPHLTNGEYSMTLALADGTQFDHVQKHWVHDCFVFRVSNPKIRYQNGDGIVLENCFTMEEI